MDSMDSDIVILKEMTDRRAVKVIKGSSGSCQQNGIQRKGGVEGSCSGEDEMDEISDFDDAELEVIDCWEENSEGNDVCKSVDEDSEWNDKGLPKSSSDKKLVSVPSSKKVGRTFSFDSDKTVLLKDSSYLVDNKTSQHVSSKVAGTDARATNDLPGKKRSPVPEGYPKAMVSQKASRQSNNAAEDSLTTIKKSSKSDQYSRRPSDLPTDSTEKKVDKFLKEIALQHPTILGLQDAFDDKTSLDSLSSDSSKHSDPELNHVSFINSSDLPPGVDFRQVCEDTTTSGLFGSVLTENKFKRIQSSLDSPYQHSSPVSSKGQYNNVTGPTSSQTHRSACLVTDVLKDSEEGREKRSRSPYADNSLKNYSSRTSRSPPPHKMRRVSHARSFSISPLPSPRSQHPPRSPLPTPRIPSLLDLNYTHVAPVYSDRHSYQPPFLGNSKYHRSRSPIRELSSTRELSRSLSRERSRNHSWSRSRSRSRDRPLGHAHSRSRHRYPSKGNRRYRRSTSRSRSPTYRPRSRSRSHSRSPQRYMSKKSTFRDERDKRLNSSESPSQSSWKPHSEASSNEWHSKYQNINRVLPVKDDVQLEQDMERFIATNMAATGLIPPPALDVRVWFDDDIKSQEHVPLLSNPEMKSPATDLLQGGMPLPPPPPDISELVENVKDTSNLREMSPEVSLSSLLESAVTGCPDKLIIERCQDAIMKLHGVSIKPGRFAVISSIKVPQSELSSTFRPWQSILKRFTALKVNFNCSKPVEQPQFWEMSKSETNQKNISSFQKDSIQVPILSMSTSVQSDPVNCGDMDRAALLDKIFFLNRELQEVRKNLGLESTTYKHVATQTTPASLCKNCIELCSSPHTTNQYQDVVPKIPLSSSSQFITSTVSTSPAPSNFGTGQYSANTPNRVHTPKPFESSKQAPSSKQKSVAQSKPVPKHKSTAKQNSSPKILPSFAPALAKKSVAVSKTVRSSSIITKPLPVSSCRISPTPELNEPPTPNLSPSIPPASHQVQSIVDTLGDTSKSPISGSDLSLSRYPSQQASSTSVVQPPEMAQLPSSLDSNSRNAGEQATVNTNRNEKVAFPSTDKKIPSLMSTSVCYPTKITDFDLSSYSMIGDEHMLDLIGYLQSVDIQVKFNSKFCSTYQTIDTLLSNLQRVPPPKQVVLLVGMYNNLFNQKLLSKYKQLVGFLRKRCSHLVLIEPPPIPRFASMRNSWNTFSELKSSFAPFQTNNVSLVFICKRLLSINNLPDPVFFVSTERLSSAGLSLIAEELKRAILEAKRDNYGLQT